MHYLILLSGGMDSFSALMKLVQENEDASFTLLHIQIRRAGDRWIPELYCVIKLYNLLKAKGIALRLKMPIISSMNEQLQDIVIYRLFASLFSNEDEYNYVVIGATKTDDLEKKTNTPEYGNSVCENIPNRWRFGEKLSGIFEETFKYRPYKVRRPVVNMLKNECFNLLPNIPSWSCRAPIITNDYLIRACGKCASCQEVENAGIAHCSLNIKDCAITKNAIMSHDIDRLNVRLL